MLKENFKVVHASPHTEEIITTINSPKDSEVRKTIDFIEKFIRT